jgi:hypothetical protein
MRTCGGNDEKKSSRVARLQKAEIAALNQIRSAWQRYSRVEKYGLAFGKICYHWQQRFAERGKRERGRGVVPILEQLNIPVSTAYWWISRYKESIGVDQPKAPTREDALAELGEDIHAVVQKHFDTIRQIPPIVSLLRRYADQLEKHRYELEKGPLDNPNA